MVSRFLILLLLVATAAWSQTSGSIQGTVTLNSSGVPLHHADVLIPKLGRKADVNSNGEFRFDNIAPGTYELVAHMHSLSDARQRVQVRPGEVASVNFNLDFSPLRETVTVTASSREETLLESFQSVATVTQLDTAAKSGSTSLGDLLDDQAGVAKRSFGPGTSRPVIRGFDGDRVLVLEDGMRTGTISSQSGDHGEPIDPAGLERIEVVRGPATLLYGSNAIGGVVNAVSPIHDLAENPHAGLAGNISATGGTANAQGGGSANVRYGAGNWMLWAGGGGMRTGDYNTPLGEIHNSHTNMNNGRFGFGRYSKKMSFSLGYQWQEGRYGVPFAGEFHGAHDDDHDDDHDVEAHKRSAARKAEEDDHDHEGEDVDLAWSRHQARLTTTVRDLGSYFEQFTLKLNYTDWNHRELEGEEIGTEFFNKQFLYRGEFRQRRKGRLSGTFGFWGMSRDFSARGAEALSPPVDQNAFAVFALEELDFERFRLQFGGRVETNRYAPQAGLAPRNFTGFSGSTGINVPLWFGGAFVANYTHSYRAPALEELYYRGPHVGNLTYEVGNANLRGEQGNGVDFSLRHQTRRFKGESNFYYYRLSNFIYLAPTGHVEDGLREAEYGQQAARFVGTELKGSLSMNEKVWLNLGLDMIHASIREAQTWGPLPRITPLRGRVGLDLRHKGLSVRPELALANRQDRIFTTETATAGYAVPSLNASYSIAGPNTLHVFSVNLFNITNQLYRNHLSFIKDLAPEIGRGVRFSYNLHFY
ncbi:MAG: TonB-dependent receptor [Bryobacterales bacterium]|nr:TonB-dependent receptor [Bryobacterales bacterium]